MRFASSIQHTRGSEGGSEIRQPLFCLVQLYDTRNDLRVGLEFLPDAPALAGITMKVLADRYLRRDSPESAQPTHPTPRVEVFAPRTPTPRVGFTFLVITRGGVRIILVSSYFDGWLVEALFLLVR